MSQNEPMKDNEGKSLKEVDRVQTGVNLRVSYSDLMVDMHPLGARGSLNSIKVTSSLQDLRKNKDKCLKNITNKLEARPIISKPNHIGLK